MYVGTCTRNCTSIEARGYSWVFLRIIPYVIFWVKVSIELGIHPSSNSTDQQTPGIHLFPPPHSGSHAYAAGTLPTDPSSQFLEATFYQGAQRSHVCI